MRSASRHSAAVVAQSGADFGRPIVDCGDGLCMLVLVLELADRGVR
jgi:hypothetical protein